MSAQPHDNSLALAPRPSADDGDVGEQIGFDDAALSLIEEDEELFALELAADGSRLPGEGGDLVAQPTSAPTRKVTAAGLGGLLGALPAPLLALLDTITLPEPVIGAISAALTLLGALSAAYLTRERGAEA
jgi:hypothetical protein